MKTVSTSIGAIRCVVGIAVTFNLSAHADLLSECTTIAAPINKSAPIVVDQITTLYNAMCSLDGQVVTLVYREKISAKAGTVTQAKINTNLRPQFIQKWCTDPDQVATLNIYNIQYNYIDTAGKYIGKMDISKRDCGR